MRDGELRYVEVQSQAGGRDDGIAEGQFLPATIRGFPDPAIDLRCVDSRVYTRFFFRRDSAYEQYTWHLPSDPETYSVFIAEERMVSSRKALKIEDVLSSYSQEKIRKMREKIVEIMPSLLYMNFAEKDGGEIFPKDAFDLSIEGMLRKVMSSRFWNRL